jgi:Tol biopolymer transport system component/tRNA A-37 threonylcarbamoyl transferase component Bud32
MDDFLESKWLTPGRWQRIKDLTARALAQNPAERTAFVAAECGDDSEMLREVLRHLADSESTIGAATLPFGAIEPPSEPQVYDTCFFPGQIVAGRFEIVRFLNRGGMGEVYAAVDLELQEAVALKTIRPSIAAFSAAIERFKKEVRQTRRVTHPNVGRVYDLFTHEPPLGPPVWFLTMELLEGEALAGRLAAGPLPFEQALPIIRDMAAGLAAAHDLGIVHRDFKPGNVMLVNPGLRRPRAVVTDFGLALSISPDEAASAAAQKEGTPAYMAPEQAARTGVSVATDQFALGLVMCDLLTGSKPTLNRADPAEWRDEVRRWLRSQPKERLNSRARRVIARCLEYRPEDRFPDIRRIVPILDGSRRRTLLRRMAGAAFAALAILGAATTVWRQDWGDRITGAVRITPDTDLAGYPSLSRDGRRLAYMSDRADPGNLDIWIQSVNGGQATRLTTDPTEDSEPSISPDGKLVVFRSERNGGGIYVVNADGKGERLLAAGGHGPVFSPDGGTVVYWIGSLDDYSAASGRLYRVSLGGGEPRRIAAEFADARWPAWSSDGQLLVFEGCRAPGPLAQCADWWAVRPDGSHPANLGVLSLLRANRILRQVPPSRAWLGDRMLFSGRLASNPTLWELTVSRHDLRAAGKPRRVTTGEAALEVEPNLAADGTLVYGRGFSARHIWRLPVRLDGAQDTRVTDDPAIDSCPSVSRDGRTLFFTRTLGEAAQIMAKDLASGNESVRVSSNADKLWPLPDSTGGRVVFESSDPAGSSIQIAAGNGQARVLCKPCANPTGWFDDKDVFYPTASGEIASLDAQTGASRVVLKPQAGTVLGEADWSPAREYLLFTASTGGGPKQIFAVRFPRRTGAPEGPWIPITSDPGGVDRPRWSTDGRAVYYLSRRDGSTCVWGQSFDGSRGGTPFALKHYHNQKFTPRRITASALGLSTAGDSVFVNVGEITVTIWKATLQQPTPFSLLRRLF